MATLQMRFTLQSGADITFSVNLSDANATRIVDAHRAIYGMPGSATAQQVWNRIGAGTLNALKSAAMAQESAAQQPAIADIPFT